MSVRARLLIADDHEVVRDGLRLLFARHEGRYAVVAEAADGETALVVACRERPDLAIVDLHMPGLSGLELIRRLLDHMPDLKVLVLSVDGDEHLVRDAIQLGVKGYILKQNASDEIVRAAASVLDGHDYFSREVLGTIAGAYRRTITAPHVALTRRETEVLTLIADGQSTKDIAAALGVSVTTIDSHRHSIMNRLNLHSVAELTKYAIREGLTRLAP